MAKKRGKTKEILLKKGSKKTRKIVFIVVILVIIAGTLGVALNYAFVRVRPAPKTHSVKARTSLSVLQTTAMSSLVILL